MFKIIHTLVDNEEAVTMVQDDCVMLCAMFISVQYFFVLLCSSMICR